MKYQITLKIHRREVVIYTTDYQSCLSIVDLYGYYTMIEDDEPGMYKIEVIKDEQTC